MYRVYECESAKRKELNKVLEADPYSSDSFARVGYKVKEGATLGEDKDKLIVYIKAEDDFVKKADETLKDIVKIVTGDREKQIIDKILKEEESAEAGLGSLFG